MEQILIEALKEEASVQEAIGTYSAQQIGKAFRNVAARIEIKLNSVATEEEKRHSKALTAAFGDHGQG